MDIHRSRYKGATTEGGGPSQRLLQNQVQNKLPLREQSCTREHLRSSLEPKTSSEQA